MKVGERLGAVKEGDMDGNTGNGENEGNEEVGCKVGSPQDMKIFQGVRIHRVLLEPF